MAYPIYLHRNCHLPAEVRLQMPLLCLCSQLLKHHTLSRSKKKSSYLIKNPYIGTCVQVQWCQNIFYGKNVLKKKAKFIHISLCFKGDIPEYLHLDYTKALAYYVTRCRGQRVTSRTSAFLSPRGKYFGIVAKEDM